MAIRTAIPPSRIGREQLHRRSPDAGDSPTQNNTFGDRKSECVRVNAGSQLPCHRERRGQGQAAEQSSGTAVATGTASLLATVQTLAVLTLRLAAQPIMIVAPTAAEGNPQ